MRLLTIETYCPGCRHFDTTNSLCEIMTRSTGNGVITPDALALCFDLGWRSLAVIEPVTRRPVGGGDPAERGV